MEIGKPRRQLQGRVQSGQRALQPDRGSHPSCLAGGLGHVLEPHTSEFLFFKISIKK